MKSQRLQILRHLTAGHKLTSLEALRKFGCLRLSGRIHELRASWPIDSVMVKRGGKMVALYSLRAKYRRGL